MNTSFTNITRPKTFFKIVAIILAVFLVAMALIGLRDLQHWTDNMIAALLVAAMAVGVPLGILFIPFIQDALFGPHAPVSRRRLWGWLTGFIMVVAGIVFTIRDWTRYQADSLFLPGGYGAAIMVALLLFAVWHSRRSLLTFLDVAESIVPQDEREISIVNIATRYAYGAAIFLFIVLAALMETNPMPSRSAVIDMLVSSFIFLLSIRTFIAWHMGLK